MNLICSTDEVDSKAVHAEEPIMESYTLLLITHTKEDITDLFSLLDTIKTENVLVEEDEAEMKDILHQIKKKMIQ